MMSCDDYTFGIPGLGGTFPCSLECFRVGGGGIWRPAIARGPVLLIVVCVCLPASCLPSMVTFRPNDSNILRLGICSMP